MIWHLIIFELITFVTLITLITVINSLFDPSTAFGNLLNLLIFTSSSRHLSFSSVIQQNMQTPSRKTTKNRFFGPNLSQNLTSRDIFCWKFIYRHRFFATKLDRSDAPEGQGGNFWQKNSETKIILLNPAGSSVPVTMYFLLKPSWVICTGDDLPI